MIIIRVYRFESVCKKRKYKKGKVVMCVWFSIRSDPQDALRFYQNESFIETIPRSIYIYIYNGPI